MLNTNFIIEERKKQIINELQDVNQTISELRTQLARLENVRQFRESEYEMLDRTVDRGMIISSQRDNSTSRLLLEDAIKSIFKQHEHEVLKIGDLIDQLEGYGYRWSNYYTSINRLRSIKSLVKSNRRGYYLYIHHD